MRGLIYSQPEENQCWFLASVFGVGFFFYVLFCLPSWQNLTRGALLRLRSEGVAHHHHPHFTRV